MTAVRAAILVLALLALAACGPNGGSKTIYREGQVPVTSVNSDDPEMEAAIQKAQDSLDQFIAEMAKPGKRQFGIKAAIETPEGTEHIWVANVSYADGMFKGVFANEPLRIPGKHELDPVEVKWEDVSDWLIMDGDRMTGGFTQKVLEKREAESRS